MIPIISVVGYSNSGKTTLLLKIIAALKAKGYRIAVIKHHHGDFEIDKPGKDTYRHREAGADVVMLTSPIGIAYMEKTPEEKTLQEILSHIQGVDLIFTEGYKQEAYPKLEVLRKAGDYDKLISRPEEIFLLATDLDIKLTGKPVFSLEDIAGMVKYIEISYLSH
jgi:molybdopterin-guanine dinucleotide biosynthesis protein B